MGRAALTTDSRVDLPAFGTPTMPTSAISFNSSRIQRSSPGSPFWAIRGACTVGDLKDQLPRPPRPLRDEHTLVGVNEVGQDQVGLSFEATVPTGTWISRSSPPAPVWFLPRPWSPEGARK